MEENTCLKLKLLVSYFAIYVIWGSTYIGVAIALETIPVCFIGGFRFTFAGLVLMGYALRRGCGKPTAANWKVATKSGVLSFFIAFGMMTWAQKSVPSSVTALFFSMEPAIFVVMSWLFFGGPRPTKRIVLAQVIGFAGCALLILNGADAAIAGKEVSRSMYTVSALSLIVCSLSWVYGSLLSTTGDSHADSSMASGMQMLAGGVVLLSVSAASGEFFLLSRVSLRSVAALVYLTLLGSLYTYSSFVFLLRSQPAAKVASHTFVNPVVAVILGWAFAGESLTLPILVAAILVVVSVLLVVCPSRVGCKRV